MMTNGKLFAASSLLHLFPNTHHAHMSQFHTQKTRRQGNKSTHKKNNKHQMVSLLFLLSGQTCTIYLMYNMVQ